MNGIDLNSFSAYTRFGSDWALKGTELGSRYYVRTNINSPPQRG